ncbi:hypothetical protein SSX86_016787 [Deinandra increscens subsp. villosa]|uniref:Ribonuclease H1 N-terminal domain-containing protein n=1 Tax=Deinandra increscens subsp. villosa TaxID=3103831 RepID=A0AAP0CYV1_9ASTR
MISDFYKQEQSFMDQDMKSQYKRGRVDWSEAGTSTANVMGREPWTKPTVTYQQESNIIGHGNRLPIGYIYSSNMLLLEQQKPQLWYDEILTWEQTVMDRKSKGKDKLIQPIKLKRYSSPMSISSEDEDNNTEKLLNQSMQADKIYSQRQAASSYDCLENITQVFLPTTPVHNSTKQVYSPTSVVYNPTEIYKQSPTRRLPPSIKPKNLQFKQVDTSPTNQVITFGNYSLPKCNDHNTKFRPIIGLSLTEKQQCLLDNLWHIQTMPQASSFKVQVLNALSIYFQEQTVKIPEKQKPKFTHYIIFRGNKLGIFNKWETVAKYINCYGPIYKGYYSFAEALKAARDHFGVDSFFIEAEEVPTFSEIAKINPEQLIKTQEDVIAKLQEQLIQQEKSTSIHVQLENNVLKHKITILEAKNTQLLQQLERKEVFINRDFNSFKARILDTPWKECFKKVTQHFPEFEQIVSQKICTEFPIVLYELQQKLVKIAFNEESYKGIKVVERIDDEGEGTGLLLLQISLHITDMPDEEIIQFYHNGKTNNSSDEFETDGDFEIPKPSKKKTCETKTSNIELKATGDIGRQYKEKTSEAQEYVPFTGESMASLSISSVPTKLGYWLLSNYDHKTNMLNIGSEKLKLTAQIVNRILGIPMGKLEVDEVDKGAYVDPVILEWRCQWGAKSGLKTVKDVLTRIKETTNHGRQFKLNVLVVIISTIAEITKQSTVNMRCLKSITKDGVCTEYNWCKYVVTCLNRTKESWNGNEYYNGPITFLVLWYADHVLSKKNQKGDIKLAIERYTTETLKELEMDLVRRFEKVEVVKGNKRKRASNQEVKKEENVIEVDEEESSDDESVRIITRSAAKKKERVVYSVAATSSSTDSASADKRAAGTDAHLDDDADADGDEEKERPAGSGSHGDEDTDADGDEESESPAGSDASEDEDSEMEMSRNKTIHSNDVDDHSYFKDTTEGLSAFASIGLLSEPLHPRNELDWVYLLRKKTKELDKFVEEVDKLIEESIEVYPGSESISEVICQWQSRLTKYGSRKCPEQRDDDEGLNINKGSDVGVEGMTAETSEKEDMGARRVVEDDAGGFVGEGVPAETTEKEEIGAGKLVKEDAGGVVGEGVPAETTEQEEIVAGKLVKEDAGVVGGEGVPAETPEKDEIGAWKVVEQDDLVDTATKSVGVTKVDIAAQEDMGKTEEMTRYGSQNITATCMQEMVDYADSVEQGLKHKGKRDKASGLPSFDLNISQLTPSSSPADDVNVGVLISKLPFLAEEEKNKDMFKTPVQAQPIHQQQSSQFYTRKNTGTMVLTPVPLDKFNPAEVHDKADCDVDNLVAANVTKSTTCAGEEPVVTDDKAIIKSEARHLKPLVVLPPEQEQHQRRQRLTKLADALKSPYKDRKVNVGSRITKLEGDIFECFLYGQGQESEKVFQTAAGNILKRKHLHSLYADEYVDENILNCWVQVLNNEENAKSSDSPARLFCTCDVLSEDNFKTQCTPQERADIMEINIQSCLESSAYKSMRKVDLLFCPIQQHNVFYVVCFDFVKPAIEIMDNRRDNAAVHTKYGNRPIVLRDTLARYLSKVCPLRSKKIKTCLPKRMTMSWRTTKNKFDSGIFAMRHMETYMGGPAGQWKEVFTDESGKQNTEISGLRVKYLSKMLLSDVNLLKKDVQIKSANFQSLNEADKNKWHDKWVKQIRDRKMQNATAKYMFTS